MLDKLTIRVPESTFVNRSVDFITISTNYGQMIVNRHDTHDHGGGSFGVGDQLLKTGRFETTEAELYIQLLRLRKRRYGDPVVALDIGANVGAITVQLAKALTTWGEVIAFEPQTRLFYALAGNIAVQNLHNAHAIHAAIGNIHGKIMIPTLDYTKLGSFGSLELLQDPENEDIGQPVDFTNLSPIDIYTLDSLALPRLDFVKIDVEKMELDVLEGAVQTIERHQPILAIEAMKVSSEAVLAQLRAHQYPTYIDMGGLVIALPQMGVDLQVELELDAGCGMVYEVKTL